MTDLIRHLDAGALIDAIAAGPTDILLYELARRGEEAPNKEWLACGASLGAMAQAALDARAESAAVVEVHQAVVVERDLLQARWARDDAAASAVNASVAAALDALAEDDADELDHEDLPRLAREAAAEIDRLRGEEKIADAALAEYERARLACSQLALGHLSVPDADPVFRRVLRDRGADLDLLQAVARGARDPEAVESEIMTPAAREVLEHIRALQEAAWRANGAEGDLNILSGVVAGVLDAKAAESELRTGEARVALRAIDAATMRAATQVGQVAPAIALTAWGIEPTWQGVLAHLREHAELVGELRALRGGER